MISDPYKSKTFFVMFAYLTSEVPWHIGKKSPRVYSQKTNSIFKHIPQIRNPKTNILKK